MTRTALAVASLLLLALVGWLWLRPGEPTQPAAVARDSAGALALRESAELELESDPEGSTKSEAPAAAEPERAAVAGPAPEPAASGPPAPLPVLQGRLEVVDARGQPLGPQSGTVILRALGPSSPGASPGSTMRMGTGQRELSVLDGRFELPLELDDDVVHAERFTSGTLTAVALDPTTMHPLDPAAGDLVIRLQAIEECTVHVLSAQTGLDLRGIEVLLIDRPGSNRSSDPGAHGTTELFDSASSPFRLALPELLPKRVMRQEVQLLVGAPNHAWQFLSVPLLGRGSVVVELSAKGSLELLIDGPLEDVHPTLTLREERGHRVVYERQRISERRLLIDDLPLGTVSATLSLGTERFESPILATGSFEVGDGLPMPQTLTFTAPEVLPRVVVSGSLRVPEGWSPFDPRIELRLIGIPGDGKRGQASAQVDFPSSAVAGLWVGTFELDSVYPGPHRLVFGGAGWGIDLEVPEAGLADLVIAVPPPGALQLEFVDAESGDPVEPTSVQITSGPAGGVSGFGYARALERDGDVWRGTCAPGTAVVTFRGDGFRFGSEQIEVDGPGARHTIEISRDADLTLKFEIDGRPATVPTGLDVQLVGPEGNLRSSWYRMGGMELGYGLPANTSVEVRFGKANGYHDIEPLFIDTGLEPEALRTVQLTPLR